MNLLQRESLDDLYQSVTFSYSAPFAEVLDEEYVRHEERKTMQRERQWLVANELQRVTTTLLKKLSKAEQVLMSQDQLISFKSPLVTLPTNPPQKSNKVYGNCRIKGLQIVEGTIKTALMNDKKGLVTHSTQISGKDDLAMLTNTKYCANYLALCITAVRDLVSRIKDVSELLAISGDLNEDTSEKQQQVLRDALLAITNIGKLLTLARKELAHTSPIELPNTPVFFTNKTDKKPNIFIHISLAKSSLRVSSFYLRVSDVRPQHTQQPNSMIGHSYKIQSKWIEVVDQAEATEEIGSIQKVVELITFCYDLCISLRNKITVIDTP